MDKTTYPGSETDNDAYDCDFHSTTSNDYVNRWVNLTVEKEVLRCTQLREEKLKSYTELLECDVVNFDLQCADETYYRKSSKKNKGKTLPCSPRSKSPFVSQYPGSRCAPRPDSQSLKIRASPRCPMRIAELAVPTKRQCFDTWRTKCDVLPAYMMERLRQQIMDEKPIVPISDAVVCFKRRRPKSSKSINKRGKNVNRDTIRKNERIAEIRQLCTAFANKIAHKLITPQSLKLNPELEKLSKVIADEITKIIQNRKKYNLDQNTHKRIHADISAKIAVWIATILEDSSYKLLEEDLKELEEEEGPVLDFIDDLVNNVVTSCEPDIQDDNVSEITSKAASDEEKGTESSESEYGENNEFDTSTHYTNMTNGTEETTNKSNFDPLDSEAKIIQENNSPLSSQNGGLDIKLTNTDHIQEEIDNIIETVIANNAFIRNVNDIETETKPVALDENGQIGNEFDLNTEFSKIQQSSGNSEWATQLNEVQSITDMPLLEDAESISDIVDEIEDAISDQLVESESDNMSDPAEESPDEKNKKVKFSEIDLANGELIGGVGIEVNKLNNKHENDYLHWNASTGSFKSDLVLAPPNNALLSNADESWPEDIAAQGLKPSASVSRSVTSLGKILEKDEKLLLTDDEALSIEDWNGKKKNRDLNAFNAKGKDVDKINNEKDSKDIELKKNLNSINTGTLKSDITNMNKDYKTEETKEPSNTKYKIPNLAEGTALEANEKSLGLEGENIILDTHNTSEIMPHYNAKTHVNDSQNIQLSAGEVVVNSRESDTNLIYEAIQQKIKSSYVLPEPKFDYKVHPKTAPSWLRQDNGKGEPSEDSYRDSGFRLKAPKFKENDIRSWCKDLDRIFQNLEIWNDWMNNTCKNLLQLKQKKEMNKLFAPHAKKKDAKEWRNLKKNIDKDAILWTKLNQKAYGRLKIYKDKAKVPFQVIL